MPKMRGWVLSSIAGGLLASGGLYACATSEDTATSTSDDPDGSGPTVDAARDTARADTGSTTEEDSGTKIDSGKDASVDAPIDAPKDVFEAGPSPFDEAGTFMVVRVGAVGGGALSSSSAAAFVEERRWNNGSVAQTIAMPTAAAAPQRAFTLRGTGTTEGSLSRTGDGAFVVLAGYDAPPGTASVDETPSATTARVVARVSKAGAVDTSTALASAFDAVSPRAAASADGLAFWVSGASGVGATGGIYYAPLGMDGVQIFDTPGNLRVVHVFGGQLYATTQSGGANTLRMFSVGTGMPTTAGQTGTQLPGIPDSTPTPHGFAMLDLDAAVAGVDTLYVADTRALTAGGGIQKWKLNAAGTWALAATFKTGLTAAPINVTAKQLAATTAAVVCVTTDNPSKIVRFLDDGVATNPTGTTVGTASANTQFRGVAITPE